MYNRQQAINLAIKYANTYPESYVTGENFMPHEWVIEAIIEASKYNQPNPEVSVLSEKFT